MLIQHTINASFELIGNSGGWDGICDKKIQRGSSAETGDGKPHVECVALERARTPTTPRRPDPLRLPMLGSVRSFGLESDSYSDNANTTPTNRFTGLYQRGNRMKPDRKYPSRAKKLYSRRENTTDADFAGECKEYLNMKAMCDLFQVHYMTIHRWEQKEKIPLGIRIGRQIYWRKGEIVALMDSLESAQRKAKRSE